MLRQASFSIEKVCVCVRVMLADAFFVCVLSGYGICFYCTHIDTLAHTHALAHTRWAQ